MGMLPEDIAAVKSLLRDERWNSIEKFVALKLNQWKEMQINGTTAFEELRALHTRDGKVAGMIEFLEQLEKQSFE